MSLINTESFMQFLRYNGDDGAGANAVRIALKNALIAAGYSIYIPAAGTQGWVVRADPIYPDRNALVASSPSQYNEQSVIRVPLANTGATVIGGFSLFVPSTFVPTVPTPEYNMLSVVTNARAAGISPITSPNLATGEIFRISWDLSVRYGAEAPQSSKRIKPGRMAFIEYRITPTEFRVWVDDTLVLQKTIVASVETIALGFVSWNPYAGSSSMFGLDGRWAISNWYNLIEDAQTPNVRLGPTTRVIGTLPGTDIDVHFKRPEGYASNAAVAALPIDPESNIVLTATAAGTQDIYTGTAGGDVGSSDLVHAISVKLLAKNVDSVDHAIRPLMLAGNVEVTPPAQDPILTPSQTINARHTSTVNPATGEAWTPAAAAAVRFGMRMTS